MKVNSTYKSQTKNNVSFKSYDARPLKGILLRYATGDKGILELAQELKIIGEKSGFDVFVQTPDGIANSDFRSLLTKKAFPKKIEYNWAQDHVTFTTDNRLLGNSDAAKANASLADFFGVTLESFKPSLSLKSLQEAFPQIKERFNFTKNTNMREIMKRPQILADKFNPHIRGGNFFIVKNGDTNAVLIGKDDFNLYGEDIICKALGVEKAYPIPQIDFHIDLGIRPLNNNVVLVADDVMTLKIIAKSLIDSVTHLKIDSNDMGMHFLAKALRSFGSLFDRAIQSNQYAKTQEVVDSLKGFGFKPVRVPGRMCSDFDKGPWWFNYINSIVHQKPDGDLVFMTNKGILDDLNSQHHRFKTEDTKKINFSLEEAFKDAIEPYVKRENVHFISAGGSISEELAQSNGGIGCLGAQIPKI